MKILTTEEYTDHKEAARLLDEIKNKAFALVKQKIVAHEQITEFDVQNFILEEFAKHHLTSDGDKPIVAINEHAAEPHYAVSPATNAIMQEGDLLLIDLWARKKESIYADITWMGLIGKKIPREHADKFSLLTTARDKTVAFVQEEIKKGLFPTGAAVDNYCRDIIRAAGFAEFFVHNTGHSIDTKVHGDSTNLRTLKEQEQRQIYKGLLFSVEPGVYFPESFGYRTEIDVYIDAKGKVIITSPVQKKFLALLALKSDKS
jgi:Xaa-Pro aminopeptidase